MSAFTHEQQRLIAALYGPLFSRAKFEALTADGKKVGADGAGTVCIRCRIPLDSSKAMVEAAMGVGGTDYQKEAVATLKLFLELKPAEVQETSEFGWHVSGGAGDLDFLDCQYSLYWYKPGGAPGGGPNLPVSQGTNNHMSLQKPKKAAPHQPRSHPRSRPRCTKVGPRVEKGGLRPPQN